MRNWVRFRTPVREVEYSEKTGRFTVTAHDLANDRLSAEEFDNVVVANGHFSVPNVPEFPGFRPSTAASCTATTSETRSSSKARTS